MRNVSDKSCTVNQNTHFVFSNFFFSENRAVDKILVMWKNTAQRGRPQMSWCMRIASRVLKGTNTHTQVM